MITRYTPLGLLLMILFFGCKTVEIDEPTLEQKKDVSVEDIINEFRDDKRKLLSELEKVVRRDDPEYNRLIAGLYISFGEYEKAIERVKAVPGYESDAALLEIYAIAQMGSDIEYSETLKKILLIDPGNIFALNHKAYQLISSGEFDKAEDIIFKTIKIDSSNSDTLVLLGDFYLAKVDSMGLEGKRFLSSSEESSLNILYKRALQSYLLAKKQGDASYFVKLSSLYRKLGNKLEAIKALNRAIELDPDNVWNYYDRGKLYFYTASMDKALSDMERAYTLDPDHFFANVFLGRIYFLTGRVEDSYKVYKRVLSINPDYYPAYKEFSALCYIKGETGKSLEYLIKLYKTGTDRDPFLSLNLVLTLTQEGREAEAKKILTNLVKYEKKGTMKGIYNYLLDPAHTGDQVLNDALVLKDKDERIRYSYYIAEIFYMERLQSLSKNLFMEVSDSGSGYESLLARYKLGVFNE